MTSDLKIDGSSPTIGMIFFNFVILACFAFLSARLNPENGINHVLHLANTLY